jgi:hypothetical protein
MVASPEECSWFEGKHSVSRQEAERIIKQSKRNRENGKELAKSLNPKAQPRGADD